LEKRVQFGISRMPNNTVASTTAELAMLRDKATLLRIDSVRATTQAGSGHPTSCASAAEILAALFFSVMRYDPRNPHSEAGDLLVLAKGHAAPLLYAAWAEAGAFPREHLLTLRKIDSDLEGHPTPRFPFVEVATGSLGQGLSCGLGIALNAKRFLHSEQRVYVLMGDGESAEGSVWEAAQWAAANRIDNLCATIDINGLGQSGPTMLEYHLETYKARWDAFGWQALTVDGHDIEALLDAYERARQTSGRPTVILARTIKGKGLPGIEGKEHWHGKALDRETAEKVISALTKQVSGEHAHWEPRLPAPGGAAPAAQKSRTPAAPHYSPGQQVPTRRGFGDGLAAVACVNTQIVVLDGDVKNSSYTEDFEKAAPERFLECYIAEQNMAGMAMGLAARGRIPFVSTFACFLTRAADFIRMAAISGSNMKLVGTHAGVSTGEDGPSQMGLEDLALMCAEPDITVLYPSDATSAFRATHLLAEHVGLAYLRTSRPKSPVLYGPGESFEIGKCKVLKRSDQDQALIVAAGVTVFEALTAWEQLKKEGIQVRVIDLFSVQPIDREELIASSRAAGGRVVTVEDHYIHGGIGDAVLSALAEERVCCRKLGIGEIPRSGRGEELIDKFGISARHIVEAVRLELARPA
jgi:transketolase